MMSGEKLGDRYEIQEQLGKKPGRQTFLARDQETQDLVVVKVLTFSDEFEWEQLKLFEREAQTLRNLSHPNIPKYLDYFELNGLNFPQTKGFALVQTYIAAKSLEEQLKSGRKFTEGEVKQLAHELLEIIIYLHSINPSVIHRDLKPSNILLSNRSGHNVGNVYLIDFGSVQNLAAKEGGTITVVGTYGYMPPEQFGGRGVPASDLYSLGATIIYLVTGVHPADLPQQNLEIQFEHLVNLSPFLITWLKLMTAPSLDKRFTSAKKALQALLNPQIIRSCEGAGELVNLRVVQQKKKSQLEQLMELPGDIITIIFTGMATIAAQIFYLFFGITMAVLTPFPVNLIIILVLLYGFGSWASKR